MSSLYVESVYKKMRTLTLCIAFSVKSNLLSQLDSTASEFKVLTIYFLDM